MEFEILKIDRCKSDGCGQAFTEDNIKLVVALYGVILLTQDTGKEDDELIGYVGVTCPSCLKTSLYKGTAKDVHVFKAHMESELQIVKLGKTAEDLVTVNTVVSFYPALKYYSPFVVDQERPENIQISYAGFSQPETNLHFYSQFQAIINDEFQLLKSRLCSYVDDSENPPMGGFTSICWFREEDIPDLIVHENETLTRLFPRYIFKTELGAKIDQLLGFHYFLGKQFEKAIEDHESNNKKIMETLKEHAYENNLNFEKLLEDNWINDTQALTGIIEQNKDLLANDPKVSGMFLDVLIATPSPLGLLSEGCCDYLWALEHPFHNQSLPDYFVDEIESDEDENNIGQHFKMVSIVKEHFIKQYVQEFLKDNLIDFLEEYEGLIQSNTFSYAAVWELKESYLKGLYKETKVGLRTDAPYAMYREGESWKIVFNGKAVGGLRGKGFKWIYYIISAPGKKVYYKGLHDQLNDSVDKGNKNVASMEDGDGLTLSNGIFFADENGNELEVYKNAYDKLLHNKKQAEIEGNTLMVEKRIAEISVLFGHMDKNNIPYERNGDEIKFKTPTSVGTSNKIINDKIKKNYRDAMKKIRKVDKELHSHFSQSIRSEGGAFIYSPSEDIYWHID